METSIHTAPYKEEIDRDTFFYLKKPSLVVLSKYIGVDSLGNQHVDDRITLVASDQPLEIKEYKEGIWPFTTTIKEGGFWPFICKLEKEEAVKLRDALDSIIGSKGKYQAVIEIGNKI